MATKILSAKEFGAIASEGKKQVKGIFSSPYVIINALNKAAKGDFSKITNCEGLQRDKIAIVAREVKALHTGRYAFDICLFHRSEVGGRIGWWNEIPAQQCELYSLMAGETVLCTDPKFLGRELCIREGRVGVFRPIALTEPAIFAAYCTIVRNGKRATEQAAKRAEREAKQAAKQAERVAKAKKIVSAVFGEVAAQFSDAEILAKAAIIKSAK